MNLWQYNRPIWEPYEQGYADAWRGEPYEFIQMSPEYEPEYKMGYLDATGDKSRIIQAWDLETLDPTSVCGTARCALEHFTVIE